jgi:hypothetical protein
MEGIQASDGVKYFSNALASVRNQAASGDIVAQRLRSEQDAKRATRRVSRQSSEVRAN